MNPPEVGVAMITTSIVPQDIGLLQNIPKKWQEIKDFLMLRLQISNYRVKEERISLKYNACEECYRVNDYCLKYNFSSAN
jgi:hypothetical protein